MKNLMLIWFLLILLPSIALAAIDCNTQNEIPEIECDTLEIPNTSPDILKIKPANTTVNAGDQVTLTVFGNDDKYTWRVDKGSLSINGTVGIYTAPALDGDDTVRVIDSSGREATTSIQILPAIPVTDVDNEPEALVYVDLHSSNRPEIFVKPGQTVKVIVTGGIPAFDWYTSIGKISATRTEEFGDNTYTAPSIIGDDFITIQDRSGDTATIIVHVVPPLLVTPHQRFMEREETKQFTVASGVPPYTAVVIGEGYIEPAKSDDGYFKFTSGMDRNQDSVIEFRDSVVDEERVVKVNVRVIGPLQVVPPEMLYIPFGSKNSFKVTGGTGDYFAVADRGYAEIDPETGIGSYTAPDVAGSFYLTIVDSSSQEIVIPTIIGYKQPFISPSIATLAPGEIKEFMVSYSVPKYDWEFEGGEWQGMDSQNSVVQITAPLIAGIYTLSVIDGRQNEAMATITVIQPLMVSPVSYLVYRGESVAVRFEKRGGFGVCDWNFTDLQEVEKGDDYIVVRPRTDVEFGTEYMVGCRDQDGAVAQSKIVVNGLLIDLDVDGFISEEEVLISIEKFFKGEELNGVKLDRRQLFLHLEAFLMK